GLPRSNQPQRPQIAFRSPGKRGWGRIFLKKSPSPIVNGKLMNNIKKTVIHDFLRMGYPLPILISLASLTVDDLYKLVSKNLNDLTKM
ncbi:MAG: hypothetical protein WCB64_13880, partial [Desulfobaccales bacterium]